MKQGELRRNILDRCPEDFSVELGGWIDEVESLLAGSLGHFEIGGLEDLHKIEDAKQAIEDIKDGLY